MEFYTKAYWNESLEGRLVNQGSLPTKGHPGMLRAGRGLSCDSVVPQFRTGSHPKAILYRFDAEQAMDKLDSKYNQENLSHIHEIKHGPPFPDILRGGGDEINSQGVTAGGLPSFPLSKSPNPPENSSAQPDHGFTIPAPGFPWKQ